MLKRIVVFTLLAIVILAPTSSFAQSDENSEETAEVTTTPKKIDLLESQKSARKNLREEIKTEREEAIEEMKAAREEFKTRLETITDAKKKLIVERVDTRLNAANVKHTERMAENLEKLSSILDRISSKAASLKSEGEDTAALDSAITDAEEKIISAQTAVTTQAGKEYVITITDEASLGETISPVVTQFRKDIKAVYKSVMDAKLAVTTSAKELKKITKGANE